jgi:type I restriction enzyme, S subunit
MSELPEGWTDCKLQDCVKVLDNLRVPVNSDERNKRKGNVPYYGATGQVGWIDDFLFDEELLLVGEDGAPFYDKTKPIAYIIRGKSWVNNHAHVLKAISGRTSNLYLKHFLDQFDFHEHVNGTTRLKLTQGSMNEIPVKLAPFNEQCRIVAKLEKLLSRVEAARARLATIPPILKRFRQSVLAAACSGRLTTDWREEESAIEDARELLSRIKKDPARVEQRKRQRVELDEGDTLPEIPTSWVWTRLGEVCLKIFDGTHFSPKNFPQGDFKYVTAKNIKEGRLDLSEITYVSKEAHDDIYSRCDVTKGDVLYIKDGATTGIAAVNPLTEQFSLLSSVGVFRTNHRRVVPEYLALFLNSPSTKDRMLKNVAGVAITRLTLAKLVVSSFCLPSLAEQQEIVCRVEALFETADALEARYRKAKAHVDKLTQSILAKAFRGELVPQDPNDEPASVLLERIRQTKDRPGVKKLTTRR